MPRPIIALAAILLAPGLFGCGFTPLYATPGVREGLADVEVRAPEGRVGFLLKQDIDDTLGHDKTSRPKYRLELTYYSTRGPRGLNVNNVADYYNLGLTVQYTLVSAATGKPVTSGAVSSQVSYDDSGQPYADIAAGQDAQNRMAQDAARRIGVQLAAWMARQAP